MKIIKIILCSMVLFSCKVTPVQSTSAINTRTATGKEPQSNGDKEKELKKPDDQLKELRPVK